MCLLSPCTPLSSMVAKDICPYTPLSSTVAKTCARTRLSVFSVCARVCSRARNTPLRTPPHARAYAVINRSLRTAMFLLAPAQCHCTRASSRYACSTTSCYQLMMLRHYDVGLPCNSSTPYPHTSSTDALMSTSMLQLIARATHVQYVNVMVPSTIVVVVFLGSLLYNTIVQQ